MGEDMRIIGGEARGRRLFAPAGLDTRPTADRIRESLFNILRPRIAQANVLDLFGGTGALGLEAISRGAARVTIVDVNRRAVEVISRNARLVAGEDFSDRVQVICSDYRRAIAGLGGAGFDLVFLDPPYRMASAYADAVDLLRRGNALAEGSVFVLERARAARIVLPDGVRIYDTRLYGETAVDLATEAMIE